MDGPQRYCQICRYTAPLLAFPHSGCTKRGAQVECSGTCFSMINSVYLNFLLFNKIISSRSLTLKGPPQYSTVPIVPPNLFPLHIADAGIYRVLMMHSALYLCIYVRITKWLPFLSSSPRLIPEIYAEAFVCQRMKYTITFTAD